MRSEGEMSFKADIGIIGALDDEVNGIIAMLSEHRVECAGGIEFHLGVLYNKNVVIARCGVGKVFAAMCAEAMVIKYSPSLLVNTGVGGACDPRLKPCDIVFADRLVQYDMDTSYLGDRKGMISGINVVYFDTDMRANEILKREAESLSLNYLVGTIATGDRFVYLAEDKSGLNSEFGAVACEMEGGAIAHVAYVNATPCAVVRAISDSLSGDANMEFSHFLPIATRTSTALTLALIREY